MPVRTEKWPEGTPTWADLGVTDLDAAKAFYTELFGWEYSPGGANSGGYLLAHLGGKSVAGLGPKQNAEMPTVWTTYLGSDDADATAVKVAAAGGSLIAPPFDVMDSGRMSIAADSVGAVFGIWQAGTHIGAERVNEHRALCWNELHARDYGPAREFYARVFGFSYKDIDGDGFVYSTFKRFSDGEEVGGIHHDTQLPDGAPNYWLAWFASDDVDATAAKARELGGTLVIPVMDSPFGRMTILRAPQGETFGVIHLPDTQG